MSRVRKPRWFHRRSLTFGLLLQPAALVLVYLPWVFWLLWLGVLVNLIRDVGRDYPPWKCQVSAVLGLIATGLALAAQFMVRVPPVE